MKEVGIRGYLAKLANQPHVLYRMYNSDGELLYIGITVGVYSRFLEHSKQKQWWSQVTDIKLEWCDSRSSAELAEFNAIKSESPKHNIVHNRPKPVKIPRQRKPPVLKPVFDPDNPLGPVLQKRSGASRPGRRPGPQEPPTGRRLYKRRRW